jgi:anthranilate synthase component 1
MAVAEAETLQVAETWIEDTETPVSAFLKLRAAGAGQPCFLLESADYGRVGRYSFIGYRPRKVLRWSLGDPGDPYELAAAELEQARVRPTPDMPPFAGGAVGMFAYDLVRTVEPLGDPNPDTIGLPDLALMLTDTVVAFDHLKRTVTVVANLYPGEPPDSAKLKIAEVREVLAGPLPRGGGFPPRPFGAAPGVGRPTNPRRADL